MAIAAVVAVLVVFSVAWLIFASARSEVMINDWAREQGVTLVSARRSYFLRGPYTFWSDRNQTVYRVTVVTADGRNRSGWVRCGGWVLGVFLDRVVVTWDD